MVSLSTILFKTKIIQLESSQAIALCNQWLKLKMKVLERDKFTEIYLKHSLKKNLQKLIFFAVDSAEGKENIGLLILSL